MPRSPVQTPSKSSSIPLGKPPQKGPERPGETRETASFLVFFLVHPLSSHYFGFRTFIFAVFPLDMRLNPNRMREKNI